ncbi:tetratricopeptide repeat protein [Tumebacillus permanentifrigoris]|uniref:Tetratricopeptide repeat protein n=1 Tax=Tumebacillus permanentifrigoris TaxID=378543 RepID=A0A316D2T2_9BACL|nr:tetratricopeptide repeat protein [Tumebacillus permanentifrigoris]PWK05089.1 tetratricopeptide repeat protein [Tumebacillus permanentifrigoris]
MDETFNQKVGRNTLALRNERGLSTDHAWKLLRGYGFSKATMNRIELARNSNDPEANKIEEDKISGIAEFHNVTPESITETDEAVNGLIEKIEVAYKRGKKDEQVLQMLDKLLTQLFYVDDKGKLIKKNGAPRIRVRALLLRGKYEFLNGNHPESIDWSSRALEIATAAKDYEMVHMCRSNIANAHLEQGECFTVIQFINDDEQDKTYESDEKHSMNYLLLGSAYNKLKDWNLAIRHIQLSIEKTYNKSRLSRAYQLLSRAYRNKNMINEAIEQLNQAMEYAQEVNDNLTQIYGYETLGEIFLTQGDLDKALSRFLQGHSLAKSYGSSKEILLLEFFVTYCNLNVPEDVDTLVTIATQYESLNVAKTYKSTISTYVARAARSYRRFDVALEYYEKAISTAEF